MQSQFRIGLYMIAMFFKLTEYYCNAEIRPRDT